MPKTARSPPSERKTAPLQAAPPNVSASPGSDVEDDYQNVTFRSAGRTKRMSEDFDGFKREMLRLFGEFTVNQNSRLDSLEEHIKQVGSQIVVIQDSNLSIEKSMNDMSDSIRAFDTKISNLEQERLTISTQIQTLEDKLEEAHRNSIKTCIELRNVPKKARENKQDLFDYTIKLAQHLQLPLQANNLRDVHRLPSTKDKTHSSVKIEFQNTLQKTELLTSIKQYNRANPTANISSSALGLGGQPCQIYASELLTHKTKHLYSLAREFKKTFKYAFVWTTGGRVYLRKEEGSPHILLRSEEQLNNLRKVAKNIENI